MSHLVNMIRSGETFKDRVYKAYMIFMLEAESTSEMIVHNDPEGTEKLFDEVKALLKQMPEEFRTAEIDRGYDFLYHVKSWYDEFFEGLDAFIVGLFQGQLPMKFINVTRTVLHYAHLYLGGEE